MTQDPFRRLAVSVVRMQRRVARMVRQPWTRRVARACAVLLTAWAGVGLGLTLFSPTEQQIGPLRIQFETRLSFTGGSEINIPPLGSIWLDSHDGPLLIRATVVGIDQRAAAELISEPTKLDQFSDEFVGDLQYFLLRIGLRSLGAGILMGLVLSALVFRNVRRVAWGGALSLAIGLGTLSLTAATVRPESINEPRFTGLLVNAPAVVGDARRVFDGYDDFSGGLSELLFAANSAYERVVTVPDLRAAPDDLVLLHVSDLRSNAMAWSVMDQLVARDRVAAVLDTGDATSLGTGPENQLLTSEVRELNVPYLYVRGDQDAPSTVAALAKVPNARALNGNVVPVGPLRITGAPSPLRDLATRKELTEDERAKVDATARALNDRILDYNTAHAAPVNVVLMHEPEGAAQVAGSTPLILTGFRSARSVTAIDDDTTLMQQGRSGSDGVLRQNAAGQHFTMSLLYFTPQGRLRAYDDLVIYGPDKARVEVQRYLVP
jgi:hypothetical protein